MKVKACGELPVDAARDNWHDDDADFFAGRADHVGPSFSGGNYIAWTDVGADIWVSYSDLQAHSLKFITIC